ncbi:MAG: D-alanyl-D-alanine carboxypeptidase, partial [Rhodobacteraceae bacterium]|nr:D-alanyl-D-alanine carboxypeptidase [Paracoccaceae bacterium]
GGRIAGDLILLGGGDPTLDTDALADLAAAAAARGIRGITGRLLVHGGALPTVPTIDPDQPAHVGYSPAVAGLNLNYNRVHFEWARSGSGYRVGMDARAARHRPDVYVTRMAVVDRQAPLYTHRADGRFEDWTVMRAALGTGGSRWLPVRQPEMYAGDVFQTLARAQGLPLPNPEVVTGRTLPAATELARHDSAPLADILRDMLRWSTNLTAETVGMAASAAGGAPPRSLSDSAGQAARWAEGRFGVAGLRLVDHSGLGDASRLSAGALVRLLAHPAAMAPLRPLLRQVELRDETGARLANQTLRVAAKTGTLNFVSGLGGYVTTPGGRDLVFAILTADLPRHNAVPDAQRERPEGGRAWVTRARGLQTRLLERWAAVHG